MSESIAVQPNQPKNGVVPGRQYARRAVSPPVDAYENADEVLLVADVPGVASGVGALVLIEGYKEVPGGIAILGAGIGATTLQMITRPGSATATWTRYVNKYHPAPGSQVPPDQIQMFLSFAVAPTGAASRTTWLPRTALAGSVEPSSMAPIFCACFNTGARSQPTIFPANFRFFSAKPSDPPISPVPTIVICRIAINKIG